MALTAHNKRAATKARWRVQYHWVLRVILLLIGLWTLAPLSLLPVWSLSANWRWPDLMPQTWSLRAWTYLFSPGAQALSALNTSLLVALLVTLLALGAGIPAAVALGRRQFQGKALVELLVFAPILVPPITVAMGLQVFFIRLGIADSLLGVILVHLVFALPYVVLMLTSAFATIGPEWEQQARSLGASPWLAFRHVVLPLLRPSLTAAALMAFLVSWSQYALTLLIGGSTVFTLPLLVFATARGSDTALAAAAALLFIVPTILFLVVTALHLNERDGGIGLL